MELVESSKVIGILSAAVLLVLIFPWILALLATSFIAGYVAVLKFDSVIDKLSPLITKYLGITLLPYSKSISFEESLQSNRIPYDDPLQQQLYLKEHASKDCSVCSDQNCSRDDQKTNSGLTVPNVNNSNSNSTSPKFEPTPYQLPKVDDLKVDPRLDLSISRFCSTVFDYYVGSYWAPYETRRQLKLAMKQFLYTLGDRINTKLIVNPTQSPDQFTRVKLIPLVLHYLDKVQNHLGGPESIFPPGDQKTTRYKMRKLTRLVLEESLSEDDLKCKLWVELCVAVLADGVLWNVMSLGRDKLPELVQYYVEEAKVQLLSSSEDKEEEDVTFHDAKSYDEVDSTKGNKERDCDKPVPFLLDNFLDRKDSLEQPDPIVSRWRPTLKDIIEETELLYPLIQYLKHVGGQKVLAYLQAVLDESPDAKDYCRRVLEVEYLPGFCRSHYFHESMGLSRVEQGMEVGADHSPGSARRVKTHSRSASYGSKSNPAISDFLKMDGGVVEGLPLHFDSDYGSLSANSSSSSGGSGYSSSGGGGAASLPYSSLTAAESTDAASSSIVSSSSYSSLSMFKRNKPPVEDIVTKFFNSTLSPGHKKSSSSALSSSSSEFPLNSLQESSRPPDESVPRVGIYAKSYEHLDNPEVNSRISVYPERCDVMKRVTELASSTITVNPWLGPVFSGWLELLHPYLKPQFESKLEEALKNFLSIDLCVSLVDLITDAFINSGEDLEDTEDEDPKSEASDKSGGLGSNSKQGSKSPSPDIQKSNSIKTSQGNESNESLKKDGPKESSLRESSESSSQQQIEKNIMREGAIDTFLQSFVKLFISRVFSVDKFLGSFSTNRDYIFLFFVDILDLLVSELFSDHALSDNSE